MRQVLPCACCSALSTTGSVAYLRITTTHCYLWIWLVSLVSYLEVTSPQRITVSPHPSSGTMITRERYRVVVYVSHCLSSTLLTPLPLGQSQRTNPCLLFCCAYLHQLTHTHIAFYCTPVLQRIYIGTSILILAVGMTIAMFGSANTDAAARIRHVGFGALVVFGLVPISRECWGHVEMSNIVNIIKILTLNITIMVVTIIISVVNIITIITIVIITIIIITIIIIFIFIKLYSFFSTYWIHTCA